MSAPKFSKEYFLQKAKARTQVQSPPQVAESPINATMPEQAVIVEPAAISPQISQMIPETIISPQHLDSSDLSLNHIIDSYADTNNLIADLGFLQHNFEAIELDLGDHNGLNLHNYDDINVGIEPLIDHSDINGGIGALNNYNNYTGEHYENTALQTHSIDDTRSHSSLDPAVAEINPDTTTSPNHSHSLLNNPNHLANTEGYTIQSRFDPHSHDYGDSVSGSIYVENLSPSLQAPNTLNTNIEPPHNLNILTPRAITAYSQTPHLAPSQPPPEACHASKISQTPQFGALGSLNAERFNHYELPANNTDLLRPDVDSPVVPPTPAFPGDDQSLQSQTTPSISPHLRPQSHHSPSSDSTQAGNQVPKEDLKQPKQRTYKHTPQVTELDSLDTLLNAYFSSTLPSYNAHSLKVSVGHGDDTISTGLPLSTTSSSASDTNAAHFKSNSRNSHTKRLLDNHYNETVTLLQTEIIRAKVTVDALFGGETSSHPSSTQVNSIAQVNTAQTNIAPQGTTNQMNLIESSQLNKIYRDAIAKTQGHYLSKTTRQNQINKQLLELEAQLFDEILYTPTTLQSDQSNMSNNVINGGHSHGLIIQPHFQPLPQGRVNSNTSVLHPSNPPPVFSHLQKLLEHNLYDLNCIELQSYQQYLFDLLSLHTENEGQMSIADEEHSNHPDQIIPPLHSPQQATVLLNALESSIVTQMKNVYNEVMVDKLHKFEAMQRLNESLVKKNQSLEATLKQLSMKGMGSSGHGNNINTGYGATSHDGGLGKSSNDGGQDDFHLQHQLFLQQEQYNKNPNNNMSDQSAASRTSLHPLNPEHHASPSLSSSQRFDRVEKPPNAEMEELLMLVESQKQMILFLTTEVEDLNQEKRDAQSNKKNQNNHTQALSSSSPENNDNTTTPSNANNLHPDVITHLNQQLAGSHDEIDYLKVQLLAAREELMSIKEMNGDGGNSAGANILGML